jgi:hypothetical protein
MDPTRERRTAPLGAVPCPGARRRASWRAASCRTAWLGKAEHPAQGNRQRAGTGGCRPPRRAQPAPPRHVWRRPCCAFRDARRAQRQPAEALSRQIRSRQPDILRSRVPMIQPAVPIILCAWSARAARARRQPSSVSADTRRLAHAPGATAHAAPVSRAQASGGWRATWHSVSHSRRILPIFPMRPPHQVMYRGRQQQAGDRDE